MGVATLGRYREHTSCVAVAHDDAAPTLILDAGTGVRRVTELVDGQPFTETILLTHLHFPGQAGRRWTRLVADTTVRSVRKFAPAARFLSYRASASRTRWTIISSSAQAVSGCSNAKGRKTHAVNSRQRNSVSAVIVAER
jgi:hypothetical protein